MSKYPTLTQRLSKEELERRKKLVRKAMAEEGYDALLVSGMGSLHSRGSLRYLTNWSEPMYEEYLLFMAKGEDKYFSRYANRKNVQVKMLGLNSLYAGFKYGEGEKEFGASAKIRPSFVGAHIKESGVKKLGICGPDAMSADFYAGLVEELKKANIEFSNAAHIIKNARAVKTEEELKWIRKCANISCFSFDVFKNIVSPGKREYEIFALVDYIQRMAGCEDVFFTMALGEEPLQKYRPLAYDAYKDGDLIFFNSEPAGPGGYFTQFARMLSIGEPDAEIKESYAAAVKAQEAGEKMLKPGVKASEVYAAITKVADEGGYKQAQHYGHGMGLDMFEPPVISEIDHMVIEAGMEITLHPRFETPSGRKVWIGDTYIVHKDRLERITNYSKELTILDGSYPEL